MEKKVEEALLKAVGKIKSDKVGIAFSGGIDSTLLALACKKLGKKFTLYTIGLQGCDDIEWATKIAVKMQFPLKIKLISESDAAKTILGVVNILKSDDPVQVGVGCMTFNACLFAKEEKSKVLLSGLGADEAFAGYDSHMKALEKDEVQEECSRRIAGVSKDTERDTKIAEEIGIEMAVPFLDEELLEVAMKVPAEMKISKDQKKIILRKIAVGLGLPEDLADRPKKAAQYGSGFDKAIERLTKKNGYKDKREYLVSLLIDEFSE